MVSSVVGVAQALSVGVLRLTQRTLLEVLDAAKDVGGELSSAAARTARGSIKAVEDIRGDLMQVGKRISCGAGGPVGQSRRRRRQAGRRPQEPERGASKIRVGARSTRRRAAARRPAARRDRAVPDALTPAKLPDSRKQQNSHLTEATQL
jgi:hypothetical protein